jgi:hypothetical protein
MKSKSTAQLLPSALLLVATIFMAGCRERTAPTESAVIATNSNASLQRDLDRVSELPFEADPAKRPLLLSQPAANRREWAFRALMQGYRRTGRTNAQWDEAVENTFAAFADYTRNSTESWPALKKALAATATTRCDDPMLQYLRVRYREEVQPKETTAEEYLHAHYELLRSQHHPLFKFMAGLRAVQASRTADRSTQRGGRVAWTTASLEDLARDTNAPAEEVFETANLWVEHSRTKAWIDYVLKDLEPLLESTRGQTEPWFRFAGRVETRRAWGERGGGYADTVTEPGWEGFKEHLARAETLLTQAWQLNSNQAETAYLLMRVELGQGRGRAVMQTWFDRAMLLDTNFYDAASLMSFYLQPRWYGSEAATLQFGRSCVTSDKWGGTVPLVLPDLHRSLANYYNLSNSPTYWHRPQVWEDVQSSYEKFFKLNPEAAGWRHNYGRDAYNCGQYSVFLAQTKKFTFGTNHAFFGGAEQFSKMLATAIASSDVSLTP